MGRYKLELCLVVLSMLRDTYWSANVTRLLFQHALDILHPSNTTRPSCQGQTKKPPLLVHDIEQNVSASFDFAVPDQTPMPIDPGVLSFWNLFDISGEPQSANSFDIAQLLDPTFSILETKYSWLTDIFGSNAV